MSVLASEGAIGAAQKIDGYTPAQRFFISYAQIWCENSHRTGLSRLAHDRSALARAVPRQRRGAELRPVRQGLRLPQGPAHDAGQTLRRLVVNRARIRRVADATNIEASGSTSGLGVLVSLGIVSSLAESVSSFYNAYGSDPEHLTVCGASASTPCQDEGNA